MANKAISKRQKLSFRIEPSQRSMRSKDPVAIRAKQRAAGPHKKSGSAVDLIQQRTFKKNLADPNSSK
ncbi:MAG: hypothetical protein A3I66_07380 [Burkholderiales bacterium RIFCSPLOWO2_02_FULL_57_36]|nr:MAG: hypothetical protein A3I66_07380 [Burkholderiales bacterium RIFCSPLOWO2_02_FULL_57_36]